VLLLNLEQERGQEVLGHEALILASSRMMEWESEKQCDDELQEQKELST
jgi:hypothetical protein